ncbi:MAG: HlyD family secretion protein [Gemmataceae bacterium]|nr:HlyD family secretion protein [Gemmataceae bacterium]
MIGLTTVRGEPDLNLPAIRLSQTPRLVRRLAYGLVLVLFLLVPLAGFLPWTQTVHGQGQTIAFHPARRPQFIVSPIEGRVKKWYVVEGDRVRAGQLLVQLVDNDPLILERLREQEMLALQRLTLADGRVKDQESRLQYVRRERDVLLTEAQYRVEQAEAQVLVAQQELNRARFDLEREELNYQRTLRLYKSALGEGRVVSKDELEEAERRRNLAKAQVPLAEARVQLAKKTLEAARVQLEVVDNRTAALIQTEEAALKSAQSEQAAVQQQYLALKTQVQRQENQRLEAPVNGIIFRILANAEAGGQLVRPGERLAVLVPDPESPEDKARHRAELGLLGGLAFGIYDPLTWGEYPAIVAELYIDGNDLPLVRRGDPVLLQFEGWPAIQFAAYPKVAAGTFRGEVYLIDPTSDGNGRFRILVAPAEGEEWPANEYLRQGVRAQGWFLLRQVSLGYEVWRVINGFPLTREIKPSEAASPLGPVQRLRK